MLERERIDVEAAWVGKYCKQELGRSVGGSAGGVRSLLTVVTGRSQEAVCCWVSVGPECQATLLKNLVDAFGACPLMAGKSQSTL